MCIDDYKKYIHLYTSLYTKRHTSHIIKYIKVTIIKL